MTGTGSPFELDRLGDVSHVTRLETSQAARMRLDRRSVVVAACPEQAITGAGIHLPVIDEPASRRAELFQFGSQHTNLHRLRIDGPHTRRRR